MNSKPLPAGTSVDGRPKLEIRGAFGLGAGGYLKASPAPCVLIVDPAATLLIGERVYIGPGARLCARLRVEIGDDVRIGPFVLVNDTHAHTATVPRRPAAPRPITIGARAIIGACATVLPGAVIGAGAEIECGAVVGGVVAPGAQVGGVPARPLFEPTGLRH